MNWSANWPGVVAAIVVSLPGLLAAWASLRNGRKLATSNGKTIAAMVEEVHGKESLQATEYETHRAAV